MVSKFKHMNNAIITVVPHRSQAYDTVGDFFELRKGLIEFRISQMENPDYEHAISIHEQLEEYSCRKRGISIAAVTAWDIAHINHPDPGSIPGCPYFEDHAWASIVEKQVIEHYGLDFDTYDKYLDSLKWNKGGQVT